MPTLALAGDTMLGRCVGDYLSTHPAGSLFDPELVDIASATDGMLVNLECCISARGSPRRGRVFHFRAPPAAVDALNLLGVRCVTLANNHALDFGEQALLDTLSFLQRGGIAVAGAGEELNSARLPARLRIGQLVIDVLAFTDHPPEYEAGADRPGVAYADIRDGLPDWLATAVRGPSGWPVLVSPHWGPNMTARPRDYVKRAAAELLTAGVFLVAGHSAHVFHGVAGRVLFDLGDFVDDYANDPLLRNDLGLLWLVNFDEDGPRSIEAIPLHIGFCHTELARGKDASWVRNRFRQACTRLGTNVDESAGRLVVRLEHEVPPVSTGR